LIVTAALGAVWFSTIAMPGKSYQGPFLPLSPEEGVMRDVLRADLEILAGRIGERNLLAYDNLAASAQFIRKSLESSGYSVADQNFMVAGKVCQNLEVEIRGVKNPEEIVIVGAHFDTVPGCPGANDNGTGVIATLQLARFFSQKRPARTLRFVAWTNEEPIYFQTPNMGSWVYAKRSRQRGEKIVAMLSLETIGYYSDDPGTQQYPLSVLRGFYPSTANFIAFVGNVGSRKLVRQSLAAFRRQVNFPSQGGAVPGAIPGVGWSDHWSFWQEGYPGIMVTDTALYRYPHYHTPQDTPDKINYAHLARVVSGLQGVVAELAGTI